MGLKSGLITLIEKLNLRLNGSYFEVNLIQRKTSDFYIGLDSELIVEIIDQVGHESPNHFY